MSDAIQMPFDRPGIMANNKSDAIGDGSLKTEFCLDKPVGQVGKRER